MSDTYAKIQSKGLDATGVTEAVATELFNKVGSHMMAVVDLQVVDKAGPNLKGKRSVVLVIDSIEPAPNEQVAEHLRELTRSFYYERQLANGQAPTLPLAGESSEPDLEAVVNAGQRHRPHPYLASTLSTDDNAVCDVCGQHEGAAVHADRSGLKDPFAVDDDTETGDEESDDHEDDEVDDQDDESDEDDSES